MDHSIASKACAICRALHLAAGIGLALAPGACDSVTHYEPPALPAFLREELPLSVPPAAGEARAAPRRGLADSAPACAQLGAPQSSVVTLPEAIHQAIFANLRVRAGAEKIQQARADLRTDSLIPNPQLLYDSLLNPLPGTRFTPNRQGGPPQMDVAVTFPLDWFLFGKRVAAMESSRLGVDVAAADFADLVRQRVSDTLAAFYDVLEARELVTLANEDLADLRRLEAITKQQVGAGGAGTIELDRVRLAVVDSQREARRREMALQTARSKLWPLLGRTRPDPDFDVAGRLDVAATAPAVELAVAVSWAEQNRPDVISLRRQIAKTEADIEHEHTKAWPQVSVQPSYTYQFQKDTIGFPDARSYGVSLTTTLPVSDRNQGNIDKARSTQREAALTLQAQLAEVRAEVQQALGVYRVALAIVTADDPATLEAARSVRDRTEAAFKAGGRRLLEVLDAQRAYRDRLRASVSGKADYWRALHRLNAAVGGRLLETPDDPRRDLPLHP